MGLVCFSSFLVIFVLPLSCLSFSYPPLFLSSRCLCPSPLPFPPCISLSPLLPISGSPCIFVLCYYSGDRRSVSEGARWNTSLSPLTSTSCKTRASLTAFRWGRHRVGGGEEEEGCSVIYNPSRGLRNKIVETYYVVNRFGVISATRSSYEYTHGIALKCWNFALPSPSCFALSVTYRAPM